VEGGKPYGRLHECEPFPVPFWGENTDFVAVKETLGIWIPCEAQVCRLDGAANIDARRKDQVVAGH
jgi:hypothetical protein